MSSQSPLLALTSRDTLRPAVMLLAAACLGMASLCFSGKFEPQQFFFMVGGLVLLTVGIALPLSWDIRDTGTRVLQALLIVCLAAYFGKTLAVFVPSLIMRGGTPAMISPYWFLTGVTGVLAGACIFAPIKTARICYLLLITCFALNGIWAVRNCGYLIDVLVAHQASCEALRQGINPFAITYPDIYGPDSPLMAPGMVKDGMVQTGYPYPPMTLMMSFFGHLLAHDVRYAGVLAMCGTAGLLGMVDRGRIGILLGALLLFMPYSLLVIAMAWTEVHVLLLLALFTWCAIRRPSWAPWVFGLFIVSKQHLFVVAPLALLAMPRPWAPREIVSYALKALVAGAVVTLPWALWDLKAFDNSVLNMFHAKVGEAMVPREDSVTFWAAFRHYGLGSLPGIINLLAVLVALIWTLVCSFRRAAHVSSCLAGVALTMLCVHAFSHHAFCNHYYLIFGAVLCSIAAQFASQKHDAQAIQTTDQKPVARGVS